jgi:hypothetical protein
MSDDELDRRLVAAGDRLAGMHEAMEIGEPWALAARFDHAPEASWGPREVLAHLGEMLPYWLGESERILAIANEPASFGRTATDAQRLGIIERDRSLPTSELVARVQAGIDGWRRRWAELDEAGRQQTGVHITLGTFTIADMADRFAVGHLEGHLDQLAEAVGGDQAGG